MTASSHRQRPAPRQRGASGGAPGGRAGPPRAAQRRRPGVLPAGGLPAAGPQAADRALADRRHPRLRCLAPRRPAHAWPGCSRETCSRCTAACGAGSGGSGRRPPAAARSREGAPARGSAVTVACRASTVEQAAGQARCAASGPNDVDFRGIRSPSAASASTSSTVDGTHQHRDPERPPCRRTAPAASCR